MNKKKYLILDMGKVLVEPTTGNWFITPVFIKNVEMEKINIEQLKIAIKKFENILDEKAETLEEEYSIIYRFYKSIFEELNYNILEEKLVNIVKDFVYNETDSKYYLYDDVKMQLELLSKRYTLILLSDNWPCAVNYLKKHDIYKYFEKVYISSVYETKKIEKKFFDFPIKEFDIKEGEAIFIDDNESLLDVAAQKKLEVMLMDRAKEVKQSKYKIINNLSDID